MPSNRLSSGFLAVLVGLALWLSGCENGCNHGDANQCTLDSETDCADIVKYSRCIQMAGCCKSSDTTAENSGMTSWRKHVDGLFERAQGGGSDCGISPCVE
eukprot:gb/GFBE01060801.1/.p2 GENE.gb/GFBE01060801.1/~~gb/GFBE01060801.1/.p2  ORF type:complete len:101 (-),score=14.27 gb/GFBE01060801.1/:64-366(-)